MCVYLYRDVFVDLFVFNYVPLQVKETRLRRQLTRAPEDTLHEPLENSLYLVLADAAHVHFVRYNVC